MRREFTFDNFRTWYDWRLTLTGKEIESAEPKTNYVQLDGANGSLDLTEALTGEVAYNDRTLTASFVTSEGDYAERERRLREILTALHGKKVQIIEPDDPDHYLLGRVKVLPGLRHLAYMELELEATCDPYRYAVRETTRTVDVAGTTDAVIRNDGDLTLCPALTVTGTVTVTYAGASAKLTAGDYRITDLRLVHGVNVVGLSGSGSVTFTYREARL